MQKHKPLWLKAFLPFVALLLTACPQLNNPPGNGGNTPGNGSNTPTFDISLNPTELTITQGGKGETTLTVTPKNGFTGTVNLSLVNPPTGVDLSPRSVEVGGSEVSETLTISTTTDTPTGEHTLTISAISQNIQKTATLTLTVNTPEFTVNTEADTTDQTPGDGRCEDADGKCSLRAAVMEANALKAPVVINIPAGTYKLTRESSVDEQGGDLDIKSDVTLKGAGAGQTILDGNAADRVLTIYEGKTVYVEGVTIQNGKADLGGGILNGGTLTLKDSTVSGNKASDDGGGINNYGTLTLTNSTVSGNTANGDGSGIYNLNTLTLTDSTVSRNSANGFLGGGGIHNYGTLTLTNSTVSGNTSNGIWYGGGGIYNNNDNDSILIDSTVSGNRAGHGGGIHNNGTLTLTNSTVSGNKASDDGGGIWNYGTLTLTNSTVSGNTAEDGGGISNGSTLTLTNSTVSGNMADWSGGIFNRGTLTLTNSTVSGNTANWDGGGIFNVGTLTLTNSTVSENKASDDGGGIYNDYGTTILSFSTLTLNQATGTDSAGGGIYIRSGTVKLKGIILAGNTSESGSGPECSGSLISEGYNLIKDSADCDFTAQATDILNKDPLLGELTDNGGPTKTHLPAAGSPVLDKVPTGDCTTVDGTALTTDQRGVSRPQGTACDIGAVERQPSE